MQALLFARPDEAVFLEGVRQLVVKLRRSRGLSDPARARASGVEVFIYLFDLLVLGGHDLTGLPLYERKRILAEVIDFGGPARLSEHRDTDGQAYLRDACAQAWEG